MALHSGRRARGLGLIAAVAAALILPTVAFADTGGGGIQPRFSNHATVDVVGSHFDSKLMATIDFAMVCDPIHYVDYDTWEEGYTEDGWMWASATLRQAQGRSIATASGSAGSTPATCDGATVNHGSIQVLADTLPLRRGDALAGVTVEVSARTAESDYHSGSSGPTAIRLR